MAGLTGVPPSTRTFLGAPPTPRFGVGEARMQNPGRKHAPRERGGVCVLEIARLGMDDSESAEKQENTGIGPARACRGRLRTRRTPSRVPDAVQRVTKWSHKRGHARLRRAMAPLIRDRRRLERSTQVGFTRLARISSPISGKPEIGVCSAPLRAALRPGHASEMHFGQTKPMGVLAKRSQVGAKFYREKGMTNGTVGIVCPGRGAARNEVERCAADPGPPQTETVPVCSASLRAALRPGHA
jgi:hypothetical protein